MCFRVISKICHGLMWVFLVLYSAMQLLAAYGLEVNNNRPALALGREDLLYSYTPLIVVTVLMWISVLLYVLWKKRRWTGLIAGGISSVAVVVMAIDLARHFPRVVSNYDEIGLTPMRLVLCHYGFLLVPLFMLLGYFFAQKAAYALLSEKEKKERRERRAARKRKKPLSSGADYSDILDGPGSEEK